MFGTLASTRGVRDQQSLLRGARPATPSPLDRVLQEKKDVKRCLKAEECHKFREAYFLCKRGQLDMRTRIRGNKGY